jgi:poly(3-hydroxybutyrate) depolymerase
LRARLHIQGRDDDVVAMTGDPVTGVPSVPALLSRWADLNGAVRNESANAYSNGHLTHYLRLDAKSVAELAALSKTGHDRPIGFDDR